jgi:signal transduction histidine kinase
MQKTLFKKYLRVTSLIIVVSFFFLGIVTIEFLSSNWKREKQDLLNTNAQSVAEVVSQYGISSNSQYTINTFVLQTFIKTFCLNIKGNIIITNTSGKIILFVSSSGSDINNENVDNSIMVRALNGTYTGQGTMNGIFNQSYYTVGVPIKARMSNGETATIGAAFTASSAGALNSFRLEILKVFFLAAIAAFLVSFCIVWLFSYKMVRPLRQMAVAAHNFGEGDFSIRVPVNTNDEIGQLAAAFNNMAVALSSSEGMRRSFIANVSHELKTPMTTIAGFIDGILDGTIPPEKQNYYLKIVSQEVKRLSRLVRTMLDLSRIDNGELRLRPARFDLTNTILVALLTFEKSIDEKRLEIRGLEDAESLFVDGDPDMIHQVVYNLFENAVKFTNEGGYIEVKITDMPDRVDVKIKNSGHGIAPDEIAMIFDRFYKTDKSRSQDKNGMGLGLYLVRTMLKLHGGEITVSSVVNEYCEFDFWLPKIPEQPKLKDNPKEQPKSE